MSNIQGKMIQSVLFSISYEELNHLYNEQGLTLAEIGRLFGVSDEVVRYRMKRLGIARRGKPWSAKESRKRLDRSELERLYVKEHLSMAKIARMFGVGETTVHSRLREYGIERRNLSSAKVIYARQDFSGDLIEKAYLIGFRTGDLWVGPANDGPISASIAIACVTSRDEQINLFEQLFSPYGHISITSGRKGSWVQYTLQCCLNRSFEFLLPKEDCIPSWILDRDGLFVAFLAGYIDAEGSFRIMTDGTSRFVLGSCDVTILHQIHAVLTDRLSIECPPPRLAIPKNHLISGGYRSRSDFWTLGIGRKVALNRFCSILEPHLKHNKRRQDMYKVRDNVVNRGIKVDELQ